MAKYDTDEIGKPGKPPKARAFPWRLWMFAIVMTAGAGAGGYYAWQYRQDAKTAAADRDACHAAVAKQKPALDEANKKMAECQITVGDYAKKDLDARGGVPAPTTVPAASPPAAPTTTTTAPTTTTTAPTTTTTPAPKPAPVISAVAAPTPPAAAPAGRWQTAIDEIQKQLARMGETAQLKMTARRGTFVMALPADALFPAGTAELSKPGELAVLEVGFTLKRYPDRRFLVTGHTDEAPAKTTPYKDSWELSLARGLTVTRFLLQAGVDPRSLIAAGAGNTDPLAKDRAKNRRVEIALLPSTAELAPLPATLGPDTFKPELKVEAPLPSTQPDATKPDAKP